MLFCTARVLYTGRARHRGDRYALPVHTGRCTVRTVFTGVKMHPYMRVVHTTRTYTGRICTSVGICEYVETNIKSHCKNFHAFDQINNRSITNQPRWSARGWSPARRWWSSCPSTRTAQAGRPNGHRRATDARTIDTRCSGSTAEARTVGSPADTAEHTSAAPSSIQPPLASPATGHWAT